MKRIPLASLPGDAGRGKAAVNLAVSLGGLAIPELGAVREITSSGAPWWVTALGLVAAVYFLRRRK